MTDAEPSVKVQVSAELRRLGAEIEQLESATPEVSASDEIARQLAEGLADASIVKLAGRGRKRRTG